LRPLGRRFLAACVLFAAGLPLAAQTGDLAVARVHYGGGGDWYNDPSCLPNLARFARENAGLPVLDGPFEVTLSDERLFSFPVLFLTGHGRVAFSREEAARLRLYLERGGFLYADDDYGMDASFREAMKAVFPERVWDELPFSHGLYRAHFEFPNGLPKIHEHDNQPPRGYGLFDDDGRVMVFYTVETNLSDGWTDPHVHGDSESKRLEALRMGTNILVWASMP
jgi:hypothetical protein